MSKISQVFYGKFRGKVTDNKDPLMQGRIRAEVPSVFGDEETGWALPCSPYAGSGVGIFFIPPVGSNIWIEFESGNTDYPIWTGGFWGIGEAPTPAISDFKFIKTDTVTITIMDIPGAGGITIETATGSKISMDITGVEISNSTTSIKLTPAGLSASAPMINF